MGIEAIKALNSTQQAPWSCIVCEKHVYSYYVWHEINFSKDCHTLEFILCKNWKTMRNSEMKSTWIRRHRKLLHVLTSGGYWWLFIYLFIYFHDRNAIRHYDDHNDNNHSFSHLLAKRNDQIHLAAFRSQFNKHCTILCR